LSAILFVFFPFICRGAGVIWVLTAGFGEGHNTAARCVAEALRRNSPGEDVVCTDLISEVHPWGTAVLQQAYQLAIIHFPAVWQWLFTLMAKPGICNARADWQQPMLLAMSRYIETRRPRAIVSTYPIYAGLLATLRQRGTDVPPLFTIITDSISVHPIWLSAPSDLYLVADVETKHVLQGMGVQAEQLCVTGFPVSLAFSSQPPIKPDRVCSILYLPSTPVPHVEATLEALRPLLAKGVCLTLPVGKHASRLYHTLRRFMDSDPHLPIEVIDWTDQMPRLLQSHDVVISKAGGAILHEVLAARSPVVIDYVVPGQEEGNAEMILKHRCGLRSHTPQETAQCVTMILENNGALGNAMRQNMRPISEPDAALQAANHVLAFIKDSAPTQ
jgi:processive 1,2-diacylglycerol beta-glucosyltransferase